MNDYSKTFLHLKKSESFIKKKKLNLDNAICDITKQKMFFKINKMKKDNIIKDSLMKKNDYVNKINGKKRANTYLDKEKNNYTNNETKNMKKISNSKSFNIGRNKRNNKIKINNNISSKVVKRINDNSRNHKSFFDNYEKNIRRKIILNKKNKDSTDANNNSFINNNNNNSFININKTTINNNIISPTNEQKFENSYFNTRFSTKENKIKEDNYFSLSQNIGTKKNNILRKINTNISVNNDKYKNKELLNDEQEYNRSQSYFYSNKTKNTIYSNYLFNNENSNNFNNETIINKNKENKETINNYSYISKNDNNAQKTLQAKQPIKIYNDNNTTINLAGSYNFHQYFNTIINNKNNSINSNNRNDKTNVINRNYNRNNLTIDNYNNKIYNNISYCQTQVLNSNNENDNKNNNFFINDKFIEGVNKIKNEMEKNLMQNPTNSKSKKYNTLKNSFEKFIKLFNDYFYNHELNSVLNLLQKLIIGYHEVVLAFSGENRKLKELNNKLNDQYENIDKNLIECNKIIKEKQNRIEMLEKKLYGLINNMKKNNFNNNIKNKYEDKNLNNAFFEKYKNREYNNNINFLNKGKEDQYNKIKKINENNLDDLDALYFFDKIDMKPQRAFSCDKIIPFLPINLLKK